MPHIVVADPIHPDGIERLLQAPGVTLDHPGKPTNETLAERLRHADGLIVRGTRVDEKLLAQATRLKIVCRHGVGYDLVDVPLLTKRGIALMITPEANAASVAEHTLMLMLSLARNVVSVSAAVRRGEWRVRDKSATFELGGRSVLVVGFGRIGTRVARLCTAFGMKVMVHDPYIPAGTIRGSGYEAIKQRDEGLVHRQVAHRRIAERHHGRGEQRARDPRREPPGGLAPSRARRWLRLGHLPASVSSMRRGVQARLR